ncbi:MAG: PaaI family thioesterase [Sphingomonadaceae bacterium]|nr:PaaI family thioesterase [Sphingomonadaceae bacterium]
MSVDSLYETMGLHRIVELNPEGRAQLEYMAKPGMCHSGGVVQGGFVTGWIDAAMAHAVIAVMGDDVTPMSLEIKVSFFAPVRPGLVVAEGWIERRGRKTAFLEGRLLDGEGNVLAKGTSTATLFDRAKVEAAAKAAIGG